MSTDELKQHIASCPMGDTPEEMREGFERLASVATKHAAEGERDEIEGYPALRFGEGPRRILYFPGGGYVFGSPSTHRSLCRQLARAAGAEVIALDYPKAPEHPWPAQKQAALSVFRRLRDEGSVGVAGDSAGGHLALIAALEADPCLCVAFSPNTLRDDRLTATRKANGERDAMVDDDDDRRLARLVFGEIEPGDPDQTLVLRDLSDLPPSLISVGTDEVLLDDSRVFARHAEAAGAAVTLCERDGFHMEELFADVYEPGLRSVQRAGRFIASVD
nr:alpha/beta hydrolase fold domain-containing protein [Parvularcula maris]